MCDYEIKNAVIESARLTVEDHGVLSGWLTLDYGGSGQGFGGHVLCVNPDSPHWPGDSNFCGVWITRVLECAGVSRWDQLVGKTIRVRAAHHGIDAIGHIVKDKWFSPKDEFARLKAARFLERAALSPSSAHPAPTARDALQVIADLPQGENDFISAGQEQAYRAVEQLFSSPPRIECAAPAQGLVKALERAGDWIANGDGNNASEADSVLAQINAALSAQGKDDEELVVTDEMIDAGADAASGHFAIDGDKGPFLRSDGWIAAYRAMRAALPSTPSREG